MKNSKLCLVAPFVLTCGVIHAGNVVTDWNTIASTTIVANGGKSPAGGHPIASLSAARSGF